jgi:hypothetical protein
MFRPIVGGAGISASGNFSSSWLEPFEVENIDAFGAAASIRFMKALAVQ